MGKYEALAQEIVKNVGGKENVDNVFHCITRLRFRLKDESKANDEAIKNMDGVVTLMKSAGQYQVVIGNHVPDVFKDVAAIVGVEAANNSNSGGKNQTFGQKMLEYIQAIFLPYLAVLSASGMIKGLIVVLELTGALEPESGMHILLSGIGDTMFYFLPAYIGYTFSNKLGLDKFVGLTIGLSLVYPTLTNIAESTMIMGVDVKGLAYNSTVFPVIIAIFIAYYLDKILDKVVPTVVKTFIKPMVILLIVVPLIYVFIGPIANMLSNKLYEGMNGLINLSPIIAGAVAAFAWQIIVIFGVHQGLVVPSIIGLSMGKPDMFLPFIGVAPFAQMAAVLTMWARTKDKKKKSLMLPAWISGVFGITEPAIYGFTLPNIKIFIAGCFAAAVGGAYSGLMGVKAYRLAGLGIFSIPGSISSENPSNLTHFLIANGLSIGLAIIFTLFLYKEKDTKVNETEASKAKEKLSGKKVIDRKSEIFVQPIKGQVVELNTIEDKAFADGVLGKGVAIIPVENKVVSPVDGTITTVFPTKHAIGITSDNGAEVLIHIGLNTVELEGKGFNVLVNEGDKVKAGQEIMDVDFESIQNKGYDITTPVIVTNTDDYLDVVPVVDSNEKIMELIF